MNTINAEPEGGSELALVVLMAPKRDVSVQVGLKFPRFMHHLVAANKEVLNHGRCARYVICQQQCAQHLRWIFFFPAAVCPASALVIALSRNRAKTDHFARSSIWLHLMFSLGRIGFSVLSAIIWIHCKKTNDVVSKHVRLPGVWKNPLPREPSSWSDPNGILARTFEPKANVNNDHEEIISEGLEAHHNRTSHLRFCHFVQKSQHQI